MERMHETYTEREPAKEPNISIPTTRELDQSERTQLVTRYKDEYRTLNPDASVWAINQAAEAFRTKLVRASPALKAFDAQAAARDAEAQASREAEDRKREAAEQARAEAELETTRRTLLSDWKAAGGSEVEFAERWPDLRIKVIEERILAAQQAKRRQAANTVRVR